MSAIPKLNLSKPLAKPLDEQCLPVTALFKGASGTGKTWTACHFPKPVLFSFDNNTDGLLQLDPEVRKNLICVNVTVDQDGNKVAPEHVWDYFISYLEYYSNSKDVKTLIFDSLTTMAAALEDKLLKSGSPEVNMQIQTWGEYQRFLKALLQLTCNNAFLKKHVVFLAHENPVYEKIGDGPNAKEQFKCYELLLPTKIRSQLDLYFSNVIRFSVENTQLGARYVLQCVPTQTYTAKTTLRCLKDKKSVPFNDVKKELISELEGRLK